MNPSQSGSQFKSHKAKTVIYLFRTQETKRKHNSKCVLEFTKTQTTAILKPIYMWTDKCYHFSEDSYMEFDDNNSHCYKKSTTINLLDDKN